MDGGKTRYGVLGTANPSCDLVINSLSQGRMSLIDYNGCGDTDIRGETIRSLGVFY